MVGFWHGFEKRAEEKEKKKMSTPKKVALTLGGLAVASSLTPKPFQHQFVKRAAFIRAKNREGPPLLGRSISQARPRLDKLTSESDRGKFRFFKG